MVRLKIASGFMRHYLILGGGVAAYTPWGTIYFISKKVMKNKKLMKHELAHQKHIERDGAIIYGLKYIYYMISRGYWNNPYEIEARKAMGIKTKKQDKIFRKSLRD